MTGGKAKRKSGYAALIGRTNVGKSTFLNAVMGAKIAIVSNTPQTTRKQILGIKTTAKGQIVFFDSPGIHKPYFKLNEKMMKDVHNSLMDADLVLYFIEIDAREADDFAISLFHSLDKSVFLVINKIDKYSRGKALETIDRFKDVYNWNEIVPISALKEINLDVIEDLIYRYLPEGGDLFPDEETTRQTERFYAAELVREKVLHLTREELPFTTTVKVEDIERKETIVVIHADIYVESKSQKKIVIGHRGSMIKTIGELARRDLEEYYKQKVYLELFVKVVPNWRNSDRILQEIDT